MPHRGQPEINTAHYPHELILYLKSGGSQSKWLIADPPLAPLPIPAPLTPGEVALSFIQERFNLKSTGPLTLEGLRGRRLGRAEDAASGWCTQHLMLLLVEEEFEPPQGWRWRALPPELSPLW